MILSEHNCDWPLGLTRLFTLRFFKTHHHADGERPHFVDLSLPTGKA